MEFNDRFWCKVEMKGKGCWLWTGAVLDNGYGIINTPWGPRLAHRVAYELEHDILVGTLGRNECVQSTCGNKLCMKHLELVDRGGVARKKLTPEQVADIRESKMKPTKLAKKYGVSRQAIHNVIKGKTHRSTTLRSNHEELSETQPKGHP